LRPSFRELTLQDLSVITDRFTSLVEIQVPFLWLSLTQITGCLAKLPHLRSVCLVVYARLDYFRLHQLQNHQAPPVVTMPGVTRLALLSYLESHDELDRLNLESIFTCRPLDVRIECVECTACQFFANNK